MEQPDKPERMLSAVELRERANFHQLLADAHNFLAQELLRQAEEHLQEAKEIDEENQKIG